MDKRENFVSTLCETLVAMLMVSLDLLSGKPLQWSVGLRLLCST